MNRISLAMVVLACAAPSPLWADGAEAPLTPLKSGKASTDKFSFTDLSEPLSDSRIKMLMYNEADVYTIPTRYGYQTNIVFDPAEEIQTISLGDRSLWQIIPSANRLFIRPMVEDVTTNMTVLTSKRSYQFDLKSVSDKNASIIYVAQFKYPDEKKHAKPAMPPEMMMAPPPMTPPPFALAPTPPPPSMAPPSPAANPPAQPYVELTPPPSMSEPVKSAAAPEHANYNYTYSGPDELAPLQVYDDGKATFIRYRDMSQPLPNAYVVNDKGAEIPVAYYMRDDLMVIDAVSGQLALKNSSGTVIVYNETLNPK